MPDRSPRTSLLPLVKKYFESDPLAAAHSLETMAEEEAVAVLKALPPYLSAQAFAYLQVNFAADVLKELPPPLFSEIVGRLESQQGAAIFMHLPDDIRQPFLEYLPDNTKKQIQELLTYPEDSAGRIMTTDFLAFHAGLKVKEVIQRIRLLARRKSPASYAYVVDQENHLVGVINMRDMMLSPPDAALEAVMRKDIFSVNCLMDREVVAAELSKRHFFAAPVVDNENRLLGIVKAEQLIEEVQEEATEDIQKLFGAGGDERAFSPVPFSLRMRLPWLYVNLATAFLAASVVALFEDVIARITILAVFLPVVAGQGGNAGAQSLAVVIRGLVLREIPPKKVWKLVMKEALIGTLNGVFIGAVTGLIVWVWHGNPYLGVVIGLAMLVNLLFAGLSGAAIPITMKGLGLDPAQCSNIILTTITDVMGFFTFLGFAVLFQNHLK
ncbi:MAG TPA: magnesium transporter [bacterium]|nr:magnesium transporter [bacterium]